MTLAFTITGILLGGWIGLKIGWWAAMKTWERARLDYVLEISTLGNERSLTVTDMLQAWEKHVANWPMYFVKKSKDND